MSAEVLFWRGCTGKQSCNWEHPAWAFIGSEPHSSAHCSLKGSTNPAAAQVCKPAGRAGRALPQRAGRVAGVRAAQQRRRVAALAPAARLPLVARRAPGRWEPRETP